MITLSTSNPPVVVQDAHERRQDLVADVLALVASGALDAAALQSRPAILRRLAAAAAHALPTGTDRLVARVADAPLATAVALYTGVPFALMDDAGTLVLGDLHPSERVVLVETLPALDASSTGELSRRLSQSGADLLGIMTAVVPRPHGGAVASIDLAEFRGPPVGTRS